jgi:uncharacterized cupin superfamily protein
MDTRIGHLRGAPASTPPDPIRPELFRGRREVPLGKAVGVTQFGVNYVILEPGSVSALRHWHECEDELVFVLSGELTLIDNNGEHVLSEGAFAGFPAGSPNAHHLANRSTVPAAFLVVGLRKVGRETVHYPDDPLGAVTIYRDYKGDRSSL